MSKIGASAWGAAKQYVGSFGGFVAKTGSDLIGSLAARAKNFIAKGCGCFEAGHLVWTARGQIPIEQVRVADWVLAQDETTGEMSLRLVVETFVREGAPIVEVRAESAAGEVETFRTTEEHPFFVPGRGWVAAGVLAAGEALVALNGDGWSVASVAFTGERAGCLTWSSKAVVTAPSALQIRTRRTQSSSIS